ncbi:aldose 1-epimerase [Paenibacillus ferrarius]|uniref:aldose 1-epimerase n=1 Tax=Paenibacillus ferrarius TaxID=1469647 RepID=UPI003D289A40
MTTKAFQGTFHGEPAIWLQAGRYEAAVLPEVGANLIAFRDTENQYNFLREPGAEEMEAFKARPVVHGIPVLFPPNRYEDGKFPWNGKVYQLPVNEAKTGNHLHGFVHYIPWQVEKFSSDETESRVTLALQVREGHSVYAYLPFEFTIRLTYTLSALGLQQQVSVHNEGKEAMPCLLAFHTTLNTPFAANSAASDYTFQMTIGERWHLNERMLPTGDFQALSADEEKMKVGGLSPFFESMDNHYTTLPQNNRSFMALTDSQNGVKLIYDIGTSYKQWMIYNNGAQEGWFCPEPQINLVNAPNVNLPANQIGLASLAPGEIWEETSRLYAVPAAQ